MGRGQITIFIIIGIVLLLSVSTVVYLYQSRAKAQIEQVVVPPDAQQVYDYVTACVDQLGREGIAFLGLQGGYIQIPPIIERNPNAWVGADGAGIFKTPFWYLDGEDRTPTLAGMQRELEFHVKQNLPDCVDNFASFSEQYTVRPLEQVVPIVSFADDEVIIRVKWPLEILKDEKRVELNEFLSRHQVRLKQMFELANLTMHAINEKEWFENLTMDFIAANPRIPLNGMEVYCGTKKWPLFEVKNELQNTLYYNLPLIRVLNTQYPPPLESERTYDRLKDKGEEIRFALIANKKPDWPKVVPPDVYEMNRMRFDVGAPETDLKAAFVYQRDWPTLLNIEPSDGGLLTTAQMKGASKYLRFLCLNQWHFTYDMIYPVKMVIRDDTAFKSEGFLFQFAFPVILKENQGQRQSFGLKKFVAPDMSAPDFCDSFGQSSVDVRVLGFTDTSPIATELEDAEIRYRCVSRECILGKTYSDGSGAIRLTTFLPEGCGNPLIEAVKPGYLNGQKYTQGQERVDLMLTKLKRLNFSLVVHPYYEEVSKDDPTKARSIDWLEAQTYSKLTKNMRASITISARNTALEQYLIYPFDATTGEYTYTQVQNANEVDFIYGTAQYEIDILLFKGDTVVGGYHAKNVTISYEDLAAANNAIFHVIEYRPLPEQPYQQAGMFVFMYDRGQSEDGQPYWKELRPTFT